MPKRVVDGEGLWRSNKLLAVPAKWRAEYANLIPLALANGVFECDPRRIWAQVYAFNRPEVILEDVKAILDSFSAAKMLFQWEFEGVLYGYWTSIDKPGRLPGASRRGINELVGPEPPKLQLRKFMESNGIQMFPGFGSGFGSGLGLGADSKTGESARGQNPKPSPSKTDGPAREAFATFWDSYPRKVSKSKAFEEWKKIPENEWGAVLAGLADWKQCEQWNRDGGQFIPYASTFLHQKRWNESPEIHAARSSEPLKAEASAGAGPQLTRTYCECGLTKVQHAHMKKYPERYPGNDRHEFKERENAN
jgi:hypothetical protein